MSRHQLNHRGSCRSGLRRTVAALVAGVVLTGASAALAQPNNQNRNRDMNEMVAPQPLPPTKPQSTMTGTLIAIVLTGLVLGVNFIPSKRGHQD